MKVFLVHFNSIFLGAISITPTLLRLISFYNESDGRFVHASSLFQGESHPYC